MGRNIVVAGFALLLASASYSSAGAADAPEADVSQAELSAARTAVGELAGALKAQLQAAMAAGGPVNAVEVCRTIAPQIAGDVSATRGLEIGRTALKVRNPGNAPDEFERRVLEGFVAEAKTGADLTKLEHVEVVSDGGERRLRYMKAIPMAAQPCQACHGTDIAPNVIERIRTLYPDDQAIGFEPGEVRGAFSVSVPIR